MAQKVSTRGQLRGFLQLGGPGIQNGLKFAGVNAGFMEITGVKRPVLGGRDPIVVPDPNQAKQYVFAGQMNKAPGFPTATLKVYEAPVGLPLPDIMGGCLFNYYEIKGDCKQLSDHLSGWGDNGNVRVYSYNQVLDIDEGDRTPFGDADTQLMQSLSLSLNDVYAVGALGFGEQGFSSPLTNTLVKDVVYGTSLICGNCGSPNDGTQFIYACCAASTTSPGAKPTVLYTLDGGTSWTQVSVSSAAVAEDLIAIAIVGDKLVVLSKTGGGSSTSAYHYATIGATGAPGTWTKVTSGFVGGKPANDIFALSTSEIFLVADGGYIYKSTNLASGVSVLNAAAASTENLLRIHGNNEILVAAGGGSTTPTVLFSTNGGKTWFASPVVPVSGSVKVQAVAALSSQKTWIGTSDGHVYQTYNQGNTWVEYVDSTNAVINDIVFATDEVGYISAQTSAPAGRIISTFTGGTSWTATSPRITGLGAYVEGTRIAAPSVGRATLLANNLAVGGIKTAGTLGVVILGTAQVV